MELELQPTYDFFDELIDRVGEEELESSPSILKGVIVSLMLFFLVWGFLKLFQKNVSVKENFRENTTSFYY